MADRPQAASRLGGDTRAALIEAGLRGFGQRGFEATSTREIAALAGANVASIAYHFGGKDGLRHACAEHIVETLRAVAGADGDPPAPPADQAEARRRLEALLRRMTEFLLLRPEAEPIAGFVIREAAHPSEALDTIYRGVIEVVHRRVCALWGAATGQAPESPEVRLAVFSAMGQAFYFHFARRIVARRLDWEAIGPDEATQIADQVAQTLRARLERDAERP